MNRRKFILNIPLLTGLSYLPVNAALPSYNKERVAVETDRKYWLNTLVQISRPVLENLSKGSLKKNLPVIKADRGQYSCLEAFARTLAGIAPWLELGEEDTEEGKSRKKYIDLSIQALSKATDPASPDYMNFSGPTASQPLVDATFLAYALLLAPNQLWGKVDEKTKKDIINSLRLASSIEPLQSNWLLFSAMVETALLKFSGEWNEEKISYAFTKFGEWYKGDGWYGDGPDFHMDYYNSIVIQPFMLKIILELEKLKSGIYKDKSSVTLILEKKDRYLTIAKQFAAHQEMMIAPDGSYLPIGRSITYRFGVFHHLSFMAYLKQLPDNISPAQVRSALTSVLKKTMSSPNNFDKNGWLKVGLYGYQPSLAEGYIDTGSLYLCTAVFHALGLPAENEFWTSPALPWSQKKIWSGQDVKVNPYLKFESK